MAGFLDDLSGLLGGGSSSAGSNPRAANGMTDFGSLGDPSSGIKNVLATLRSAGPGAASPQGQRPGMPGASPAGASAAPVGGAAAPIGASLSPEASGFAAGIAAQRPGQSGGGAFLSGLAGALGGRQNAIIQNQKLALEQQQWNLEAQKQQLQIDQIKHQNAALAKLAGGSGTDASAYPPDYHGPGAPDAGSAPPPQAAPPMPQGGGAIPGAMPPPGAPPQAGPPPAPPTNGDPATPGVGPVSVPPQAPSGPSAPSPAPMPPQGAPPLGAPPQGGPTPQQSAQPAPQAVPQKMSEDPNFYRRLPPNQNPFFLRAQADKLQKQLDGDGVYLPDKIQDNMRARIQQYNSTAMEITKTGQVMGSNGRLYMIPGFAENQVALESAKTAATEHIKAQEAFRNQDQVTDSGTKFKPDPNVPVGGGQQPAPAIPVQQQESGGATPAAQQPTTSRVDPETAEVQTAIPKAPAGGGFTHDPSLPAGAAQLSQSPLNKARSDADEGIVKEMATNAGQLDSAKERLTSLAQAYKLFKSGTGAERVQSAALMAQYYNFPDWVRKGLVGEGDPAAMQWVEKEGVPIAFNIVRAGLPTGSMINRQEFKVTEEKATPGVAPSPQANHQNIAEQLADVNYRQKFASDWEQAQKQGWQSPSAFYQSWSKANKPGDFISSAQRSIGNFQGMPTPRPDEMAAGSVYVYDPKDMPQKVQQWYANEGIKPGALFRWNGTKAQQAITPLDTSQGRGFNIR